MRKRLKRPMLLLLILMLICSLFLVSCGKESKDGPVSDPSDGPQEGAEEEYTEYTFRNAKLLSDHYKKHGIEMGFPDEESYEKAASLVANDPDSLHKTEKEDGDDVYFLEETGEFVVISTDGYIRTYFIPRAGKDYFDRQ